MTTSRFLKGAMYGIDLAIAATEFSEYLYDGDDFMQLQATGAAGSLGGYIEEEDGDSTLTQVALLPGICASLATAGAATDDAIFLARQTAVGAFDITIDSGRKLAFESRFMVLDGTDIGIFVGLAEAGLDHDIVVDGDGLIADVDAVGFTCAMHATDVHIDGVTRLSGAALQTGAETITEDEDGLFNTYGFRFDGYETIDWYLNNEKFATQTIVAAEFPTGQSLTPVFCVKNGDDGTDAKTMKIDYWVCVQDLLSSDRPE